MKLMVINEKLISSSFYRAHGIFNDLCQQMKDLQIIDMAGKGYTWADILQADAVYLHSPYSDEHSNLILYLKEMNKPVWVDYDDDLFHVPDDNPMWFLYSNLRTQENIKTIIQLANQVSVSTASLANVIQKLNKNTWVIPNAYNNEILNFRREPKRNQVVVWRGSNTHEVDLMVYADAIAEITNKADTWKWVYLGYHPWFIRAAVTNPFERMVSLPITDPIWYYKKLRDLNASCMQVPLADNIFNHCKSNIAWIEGTYAGCVCLVPEWEEWNHPGAITYKDTKDYGDKLKLITEGAFDLTKQVMQSYRFIQENFALYKINRIRMQLLKKMMEL